jgi:hypothetical protein
VLGYSNGHVNPNVQKEHKLYFLSLLISVPSPLCTSLTAFCAVVIVAVFLNCLQGKVAEVDLSIKGRNICDHHKCFITFVVSFSSDSNLCIVLKTCVKLDY